MEKKEDAARKRHSQTICRSVSFLKGKSYKECFNSAIESPEGNPTTAVDVEKPESNRVAQTTNGVEWEYQDLSLYLGSLGFSSLLQIDSARVDQVKF